MSWVLGVVAGALMLFVMYEIETRKLTKQIEDVDEPATGKPVADTTEYKNLYTTQEQYNRYDGTEY